MNDSREPEWGLGTTTLLQSSEDAPADRHRCKEIITGFAAGQNLLVVLLTETIDTWADEWRGTPHQRPAKLGFVTTDGQTRATAAHGGTADAMALGDNVTMRRVSRPGDLTGLGITINKFLSSWEGDEQETLVYVDSLSVLLQSVDRSDLFRFLHVMTSRIESANATLLASVDESDVDEQALSTIRPLFEDVVSVSG